MLHGTKNRTSNTLCFHFLSHVEHFVLDWGAGFWHFLAGGNQSEDGLAMQVLFKVHGDEVVFDPVRRIDGRNMNFGRTSQYKPPAISTTITDVNYIVTIAHGNGHVPFAGHFIRRIFLDAVGAFILNVHISDIVDTQSQLLTPLVAQLFFVIVGDIPIGISPLRIARH